MRVWQPEWRQPPSGRRGFGEQLEALGVPQRAQFNCASALLNYILGLAGQYAADARLVPHGLGRVAGQLPGHDDREQFLAGINLILAGIVAVRDVS